MAGTDQHWTLTLIPRCRNTGTGRFVTIAQGASDDLTTAVSWTETGTPDQSWTVRRVN